MSEQSLLRTFVAVEIGVEAAARAAAIRERLERASGAAECVWSQLAGLPATKESSMRMLDEEPIGCIRPRPTQTVSLRIPTDTLEALQQVAARRDMSCEALLKFYIGQGLRQDLARSAGRER